MITRRRVLTAAASATAPLLAGRSASAAPAPPGWDSTTLAGVPGFFRVGKGPGGAWWFADPDNKPFFFRGVTSVSNDGWATQRPDGTSYVTVIHKKYGSDDAFREATLRRLSAWGFNALGGFTGDLFWDKGYPYTMLLDFNKIENTPHIEGAFLPDVFDPTWEAAIDGRAKERCAPYRNSRLMVGYFTDNEMGWSQLRQGPTPLVFDPSQQVLREKGNPSLLQLCLALPPDRAAHKASWRWLLTRYDSLDKIAASWGVTGLDSAGRVAAWTADKRAILSAGYLSDDEAWSQFFAEQYFRKTAETIRRYDTNHLILGCRFGGEPGPAILAAHRRPWVDVLSANNYRDTMYERVDGYYKATGQAVLIGEFAWVTGYFLDKPLPNEPVGGLSPIERMMVRGPQVLERAFTHPALAGYAWYRWVDKADFKPPISYGLVSVTDEPNATHLGMLRAAHARADALHAGVAAPFA